MRYLLLLPIHLYWLCLPAGKRKRCLFKESCSCFVYRAAKTKGLIHGAKAFRHRFSQCRPGYEIKWDAMSNEYEVVLRDGTIIKQNKISTHILPIFD